ncbi:GNAT family protein [Nocardioides sp.]|uniref:GNAT family N-acetyltransferase n=1 Tax=Nocardioides sp. TaxID=35761 RepID=UPI00261230AF|nr:GNAT family protein [Nocardioides sp.]
MTSRPTVHPRDLGDGAALRLIEATDAAALTELRLANRAHLARSGPERSEEYFTLAGQEAAIDDALSRFGAGLDVPLMIVDAGHPVGQVSLSNIVRGPLQSANLGYWIAAAGQGRGLVSRAVAAMIEVARDDLGLHRLEAGTLVDNERSQSVLLRAGFERIGLARRLLLIEGQWEDHVLFQRLLDE